MNITELKNVIEKVESEINVIGKRIDEYMYPLTNLYSEYIEEIGYNFHLYPSFTMNITIKTDFGIDYKVIIKKDIDIQLLGNCRMQKENFDKMVELGKVISNFYDDILQNNAYIIKEISELQAKFEKLNNQNVSNRRLLKKLELTKNYDEIEDANKLLERAKNEDVEVYIYTGFELEEYVLNYDNLSGAFCLNGTGYEKSDIIEILENKGYTKGE